MNTRLLPSLAAMALLTTACGPHTMRGRVVVGESSYITVVDQDDHRLHENNGVAGALLKLQLDPGRINRRVIAEETSDDDGTFTLPVDEFGAGVLELECGLLARRRGFKSAEGVFMLPSKGKSILIVMTPGRDAAGAYDEEPSAQEQIERFK
ncbi:MAG: hypothetical protein JNK58_10275 [Phycisphaerae bacterium]|nr:hypothetical protein [Phycisphaerae bacterium]